MAQIGRPTKYKPEYCEQIVKYFRDVEVVERIEDPNGKGGITTHFEPIKVPSILGFAAKIGVNQDTLYEWAKAVYPKTHKLAGRLKYPKFSEAFTRAQQLEKALIFEYGMAGYLDKGLAALYFTNHLDFKDSRHLDMTSDGDKIEVAPLVISNIESRGSNNESKTD
jgi:hypothetical protein